MTVRDEAIDQLRRGLLDCRNGDGGWGYYAGKQSRLEPTAWALLAFGRDAANERAGEIVETLARWQRPDGLLACVASAPPNLAFNGLAAFALMHAAASRPSTPRVSRLLGRLVPAITRAQGSPLPLAQRMFLWVVPSARTSRQDDTLRGWPWIDGTFSWVEPTAWCLLALKRSRGQTRTAAADGRIDQADRLLLDRCCVGGGWNYGNSNMLGHELAPYVPTTAIGLLAMQDHRDAAEVRRSIDFLVWSRQAEVSAMALSLTALALRAYGLPADGVEDALIEDVMRTDVRGNNASRAMALCALRGGSGDATPFAL